MLTAVLFSIVNGFRVLYHEKPHPDMQFLKTKILYKSTGNELRSKVMTGEMPIYGPGTTNRLIPWFTVSNAPYNYALPQYLGNRLSWGTWGGENQPVLFPAGRSNFQYALAQDYNNPNHIRQWNPLLIGFNLNEGTTNPIAVAKGNMDAYNAGASFMAQQLNNQKIGNVAQALGSLEAKLQSALQNDKLTDAQRAKLQKLLEKVQAKKAEIQQKLQNGQLSQEDIEAIQGEVLAVQKEISETVENIIKEIETGKTSNGNNNNESSNGTSHETDENTDGVVVTEKAAKQFEAKQKKALTSALDICKTIYAGSQGHTWGTDYDTIRKGTAKINKDNAAMVVLAWDKQITPNGKKSLVKALFDEEHVYNPSLQKRGANNKVDNSKAKNIDMIWNITSSLEEKAKELGIYDELAGQFITAYDELDDTFVDQDAIENAVYEIAAKVYEKQAEKEALDIQKSLDKGVKSDKTIQKENEAKQAQESKQLFAYDMKEIYKDDSLEVSNRVEYANGKFTIRIEGKNYSGKDFVELSKAIKDAGYDPKEYLTKSSLKLAA